MIIRRTNVEIGTLAASPQRAADTARRRRTDRVTRGTRQPDNGAALAQRGTRWARGRALPRKRRWRWRAPLSLAPTTPPALDSRRRARRGLARPAEGAPVTNGACDQAPPIPPPSTTGAALLALGRYAEAWKARPAPCNSRPQGAGVAITASSRRRCAATGGHRSASSGVCWPPTMPGAFARATR